MGWPHAAIKVGGSGIKWVDRVGASREVRAEARAYGGMANHGSFATVSVREPARTDAVEC